MLIEWYASFEPDSVIAYAPKMIRLAENLKHNKFLHRLYCHLCSAYCFKHDYENSQIYIDKAIQLAVKMKNRIAEAKSISLNAYLLLQQGKYIAAIDMYLKALLLYKSLNDIGNHIFTLSSLCELNRKLGNTSIAIQYLDQSAELCKKLKSTSILYIWRITQIYNEYALIYFSQNKIDKAFEYALKADSLNTEFVINKCHSKILLAKIYLRLNDYKRALEYAGQAIFQANILKSDNLYIDVLNVLSEIYLAQQQYPEAEIEAFKAWNFDSTYINESRIAATNIATANIYMQNADKAAYYFKKCSELNDRYSEKSFHTTISDLSIKYEVEKKEMLLSSIEHQRLLYLSISFAGILSLIAVWIIFRQKMRRERTEKKLIATRAILEGQDKERERVARDLHDGINGMLTSIKTELNSMKCEYMQEVCGKLDKCIEEIHHVVAGIRPSSLSRFGMKAALEDYCRRFSNVHFYFFGNDNRINEKIEVAIYSCAYELVNNSVKHSDATTITVQLIQENHRVALAVQDNGKGFDKKKVVKGSGLKNISYRAIALNAIVEIVTSPGMGTETNIEFKL
jgi:signal transduction histidine kinase